MSNAVDKPSAASLQDLLDRQFVSSAVPNPANIRIVPTSTGTSTVRTACVRKHHGKLPVVGPVHRLQVDTPTLSRSQRPDLRASNAARHRSRSSSSNHRTEARDLVARLSPCSGSCTDNASLRQRVGPSTLVDVEVPAEPLRSSRRPLPAPRGRNRDPDPDRGVLLLGAPSFITQTWVGRCRPGDRRGRDTPRGRRRARPSRRPAAARPLTHLTSYTRTTARPMSSSTSSRRGATYDGAPTDPSESDARRVGALAHRSRTHHRRRITTACR